MYVDIRAVGVADGDMAAFATARVMLSSPALRIIAPPALAAFDESMNGVCAGLLSHPDIGVCVAACVGARGSLSQRDNERAACNRVYLLVQGGSSRAACFFWNPWSHQPLLRSWTRARAHFLPWAEIAGENTFTTEVIFENPYDVALERVCVKASPHNLKFVGDDRTTCFKLDPREAVTVCEDACVGCVLCASQHRRTHVDMPRSLWRPLGLRGSDSSVSS